MWSALNVVYLALGYALPVAAFILVPLGGYLLFLVGVTLVELVRP